MALTIIKSHYSVPSTVLPLVIQTNTILAYYTHFYIKIGVDTINNETKQERRYYHDFGLAWFKSLPEVISIFEPIEDRRI